MRERGALAALIVILIGLAGAREIVAQPAVFEVVGIHPQAAKQRTARGKTLAALEAWQGQVFAGYGDYGANTGPISISPFDPASGRFEQVYVSDTEAILNWRAIGDRLFAPATDRRTRADYAVGEPWMDVSGLNTTHAYDIVTLDGSDLWLVGSQSAKAAVWRSLDGGESWKRSLAVGPESTIADDFARFYFAGVLEDRLYVQASDYSGGTHARAWVFDGTAWSQGPSLLPAGGMGWRPVPFAGEMVYRSNQGNGSLLRFDGQTVLQSVAWNMVDLSVDGEHLIALTRQYQVGLGWGPGPIIRTRDLQRWEALETPPPEEASSIAVLAGRIYLGDKQARLHRLDGAGAWRPIEGPRWNAHPQLRVLAPRPDAVFAAGSPITFLAEASDADGNLSRVQVWKGSERLGEPRAEPFAVTWTDPPTGTHAILVRAVDEDGAMTAERFSLEVVEAGNRPPAITDLQARPSSPIAGASFRLLAQTEDPDGDAVEVRWMLPGGAATMLGEEIRWSAARAGGYDFTAIAEDDHGAVALRTIRVDIRPAQGFLPFLGRRTAIRPR